MVIMICGENIFNGLKAQDINIPHKYHSAGGKLEIRAVGFVILTIQTDQSLLFNIRIYIGNIVVQSNDTLTFMNTSFIKNS